MGFFKIHIKFKFLYFCLRKIQFKNLDIFFYFHPIKYVLSLNNKASILLLFRLTARNNLKNLYSNKIKWLKPFLVSLGGVLFCLLFANCSEPGSFARIPSMGYNLQAYGITNRDINYLNGSIRGTELTMRELERLSRDPRVSPQQLADIRYRADLSYGGFSYRLGNLDEKLYVARDVVQDRINRLDESDPAERQKIDELYQNMDHIDNYLLVTDQARRSVRGGSFRVLDSLETAAQVGSSYASFFNPAIGLGSSLVFGLIRGIVNKRTNARYRRDSRYYSRGYNGGYNSYGGYERGYNNYGRYSPYSYPRI